MRATLAIVAAVSVCLLGVAPSLAASDSDSVSAAIKAEPQLPLGSDVHGVFGRIRRGTVVFRFTSKARGSYARIARRSVIVGCSTIGATAGSGFAMQTSGSGDVLVAPAHRRSIAARVGIERPDVCTIVVARSRKASAVEVVAVPVSQRGAAFLSRRQTARDVLFVVALSTPPTNRSPLPATKLQTLTRGAVVPLAGPNARPPDRQVGYWTDGRAEIYVAEVTFDGTVFFFDDHLDTGVVTTNLLGWMSGQDLGS